MNEKTDKKQLNFMICRPDCDIPVYMPVETVQRNGMVSFGEDNQFSQHLYEHYSDCSLLQSLCNGTAQYVAGSGFADEEQTNRKVNKRETLWQLLQKIALDYEVFGAFALQVRRNTFGDVVALDYVDVAKVRLDEDESKVYVSATWQKYTKDVKTYELYSGDRKQNNSIYYFKNPMSKGAYGLPCWSSALKEAMTLTEISQFHLSSIQNGLASSFILNFNNGTPTDEEQSQIEEKIQEKFGGSRNAGRYMLSFNESKENGVDIQAIPQDNFDSKYMNLKETSQESLMTAFRAPAQLFGVSSQSTGFSSIEYKNAFKLYNKTVVEPIQRMFEQVFDELGFEVEILPFEIEFDENNPDETI